MGGRGCRKALARPGAPRRDITPAAWPRALLRTLGLRTGGGQGQGRFAPSDPEDREPFSTLEGPSRVDPAGRNLTRRHETGVEQLLELLSSALVLLLGLAKETSELVLPRLPHH